MGQTLQKCVQKSKTKNHHCVHILCECDNQEPLLSRMNVFEQYKEFPIEILIQLLILIQITKFAN